MKQTLRSATASFAHLLSRPASAKPAAEAEPAQREDESDEDFKKRHDKWEEEQDASASASASARAAKADAEPEQGEDESDEDFKKRYDKWKEEQGDDDDDSDAKGDDKSDSDDMRKKGTASARLRERTRCAAIFADPAAGKNQALAATLAFNTDLPRSQAVKVLRAGGLAVVPAEPAQATRPTLDTRMRAAQIPVVGAGDAPPPGATPGRDAHYHSATQIIASSMKRDGASAAKIAEYIQSRA